MESMVSKTFLKVIGFAGCLLLTILAGIMAMLAISLFIFSIIDGEFLGVAASAASAFIAALCWSLRKDTLV